MSAFRLTGLVALLALSGCSLISGGAPTTAGLSDRAKSKSRGKALKASADDPPHVTAALTRLDKMAELIENKKFEAYAKESGEFHFTLLMHDGWAGENKHDAIAKRLDELDAEAFPAFGGRLAAVGTAVRVLKADPDALEATAEMLSACSEASSQIIASPDEKAAEMTKRMAKYEKMIAKVKKLDPTAFRYIGEIKGHSTDVATDLMECEVHLGGTASEIGDDYVAETYVKVDTRPGCGKIEWLAEGVQIGSGSFGTYSRSTDGNAYADEMPCNKMPKASRLPANLREAAKDFADHVSVPFNKLVIVTAGKPYTEVNEEDLHVYRYQKLISYSKVYQFNQNPCGAENLFCESGGSQGATEYNKMEHYFDRAAAHRGKDVESCKDFLKKAKDRADWFDQFHAGMVKDKKWIAGATYKTKKGAKLKEKDFVASFADKGKLAEDQLDQKWCSKASVAKK